MRLNALKNFALLGTQRTPHRAKARVCFVIDRLCRAGTETQLLALIRNLDRSRVEPSLCLLNGNDAESRALLPADCPTIDLGLPKLISPRSLSAAVKLRAFWKQQQVNIVQAYFLDSSYFAVPLARICAIRHAIRVRNNAGYWLTSRHRMLGRAIGRFSSTLTNSELARDSVMEAEGLKPTSVRVIENGVDLDRFANLREPDTAGSTVRVGAIANLRPVKNIDGLIRVASSICKTHPRVQFQIAGEGEDRTSLQREIDGAGLSSRFELLGSIVNIPEFLSSCDLAINCSHSESMSNAVLEYMAAGRAIVATDVGANARLIRHGVDGLIVPANDDLALEHGIGQFLTRPRFARKCGESARRRAEAEYSRKAMIRRFEEFFLTLVK